MLCSLRVSIALLAIFGSVGLRRDASQRNIATGDRAITQVVKLLETMLKKSKEDADIERDLYAKFKCYCDSNEKEKTESIETLTQDIERLEAKIGELQASTGTLSSECAQLEADISANADALAKATKTREDQNTAFKAEEKDLEDAIGQMEDAIKTLAEVGGDQTLGADAAHTQYMADYKGSLLNLRSNVKQALLAASALVSKPQLERARALLQAPSYSSQSGEVVGILKEMLDTFNANLATARTNEAAQLKAFEQLKKTLEASGQEMQDLLTDKQASLGTNDGDLADARQQKKSSEDSKSGDQDFLDELLPMCALKAKEFKQRNALRARENAAITEAISILNSDAAFATFGKVTFLQLGSSNDVRHQVLHLLTKGASKRSARVSRIAALLKAGNPFATVLKAIDETIKMIRKEGTADQEKLDWCNGERTTNFETVEKAKTKINTLSGDIQSLKTDINHPDTGLIAQIAELEKLMEDNRIAQEETVSIRKEEITTNNAYVKDAETSLGLLTKAIKVLEKFYVDAFKKESLMQAPEPPSTGWESGDEALGDEYAGQREGATGSGGVIELLNTIKSDLEKNLETSHSDEMKGQADFEDAMTQFENNRRDNTKNLIELKDTLAKTEEQLANTEKDLRATIKVKNETEAYLESIKEGCDFFTDNINARNDYRDAEINSLQSAKALLEETPVFQQAVQRAKEEKLGKCLEKCRPEETAECQACLEKVTVAAYCAKDDNKSMAGC